MRHSTAHRLSVMAAVVLVAIGLFGPGPARAGAGDVEGRLRSIPPGEYRVQRWAPPPSATERQLFYLLTIPPGPGPAIRERFFVTDLGVLSLDAIARDVEVRADGVAQADLVVERLRAGDGTVTGHVVRTRDVRFSVARGGGRQPAVYLHAGEMAEGGGGGGM